MTKANLDLIQQTKGGEFIGIVGHTSKRDESVKNRLLRAGTGIIERTVDQEERRIVEMQSAYGHTFAASMLAPYGIDTHLSGLALAQVVDRIDGRRNGTNTGALETHVVATDAKGRTLLRLAKDQRSGEWSLQIIGEQEGSWLVKAGTIDWGAENKRLFDKCIDGALTQQSKWFAESERLSEAGQVDADPSQSISKIVALLNKCLDRVAPIDDRFRTINLMGRSAITCDSVAIHGERFTNMISVVAHYRPDLVGLLQSKAV